MMKRPGRVQRVLAGLLWVLPAFFAVFLPQGVMAGSGYAGPYTYTERAQLISEYQGNIQVNRLELERVKNNRIWLETKIQKIQDRYTPVPCALVKSLELAKFRMEALDKDIARLKDKLQILGAGEYPVEKGGISPLSPAGSISEVPLEDHHGAGSAGLNFSNASSTSASSTSVLASSGPSPAEKQQRFRDDLARDLKSAGLDDWFELTRGDGCSRLINRLPILFATAEATVAHEYKDLLKKLAGFLADRDVKILVDGYADIRSINTKKYPSNFELGADRAANVVHELEKFGIKPSVFQVGTTGRYRFAAKGMSRAKGLERRVDLAVVFSH
ncbi:MAG: hypothetical protein B6230_07965 [Desulfobacteraceae bacterium 4572_89]|nr:MAG: hypothetical protein B6230_07965 [Desulfobacteraceae bacterium 4572_89]